MRRAAYQKDVVVDRLGYAYHSTHDALLFALFVDGVGSCVAAVAAHHVELVDAPQTQALRDGADISTATGCALRSI